LLDSSSMRALSRFAVLLLVLAGACKKPELLPSADYERARLLHVDLLARYYSDAYARPEIDEILALLERVPVDSADAEAAADLKGRVLEGRRLAQEHRAELDRLLEAAGPVQGGMQPSGGSAGTAGATETGEPPPVALRLSIGMKLEDFKTVFSDCFEMKTPIQIAGLDGPDAAPQPGEAWGVKDTPECKERYAAQAQSYVLFAGGVLKAIRPASEAVRTEVKEKAKPETIDAVKLPDGRYARKTKDGLVPIPPEKIIKK
jgi:hypothetical protein